MTGLAPILIVEDDPGTRAALSSLLNFTGYTTQTARSAEEALLYLRAGAPVGAIVLDLGLPGMDGAAFHAIVRDHPEWARIPVVVYSAWDQPRLPGVVGHVLKTSDPDELLALVARAYDRTRAG